MLQEIILKVIKHKDHRYETIGDWFENDRKQLEIRSSDLQNWRMEFLIQVHELIEWALCKKEGITQEQVDKFDKKHQHEQSEIELGDLPNAPYRKQHCVATGIERLLAAELDVPWSEYEEKLSAVMGG